MSGHGTGKLESGVGAAYGTVLVPALRGRGLQGIGPGRGRPAVA